MHKLFSNLKGFGNLIFYGKSIIDNMDGKDYNHLGCGESYRYYYGDLDGDGVGKGDAYFGVEINGDGWDDNYIAINGDGNSFEGKLDLIFENKNA